MKLYAIAYTNINYHSFPQNSHNFSLKRTKPKLFRTEEEAQEYLENKGYCKLSNGIYGKAINKTDKLGHTYKISIFAHSVIFYLN